MLSLTSLEGDRGPSAYCTLHKQALRSLDVMARLLVLGQRGQLLVQEPHNIRNDPRLCPIQPFVWMQKSLSPIRPSRSVFSESE